MRRSTLYLGLVLTLFTSTPALSAPDEPASAAAPADVLVLRDGRRLEGRVVGESEDGITFQSGAATRLYARTDVERVERAAPAVPSADGGGAVPPPAAAPGGPPEKDRKGKNEFGKKGKVLTEAARVWVKDLAARAESEDEQVRRSIAAALQALGPAAVPAIREAAAAATSPSAKQILERVAADMADGRRGDRPPAADAPPVAQGPDMAGGSGAESSAPGMQPPAGPARDAGGDRRGARTAADRLAAELELREDQIPTWNELKRTLETKQFGIFREVRQGGLAQDAAAARLDGLRKEILESARSFLDAAQADLFEDALQRYFDGALVRLTRGEGKSAPPAEPKPAPETPPAEPSK